MIEFEAQKSGRIELIDNQFSTTFFKLQIKMQIILLKNDLLEI
jgi:hypothetical protein